LVQAQWRTKIRAAIQASDEPAWVVAERYGISEQTVWKWRNRDSVYDRSHTPHRLQTTLTPPQEAVAVALRKALLLPLDDLLAVVREFLNPHVSRSGLDRCLRRHGVGNLQALRPKEPKPAHGTFKAYEPGYLHIDIKYLPQMAGEERRRSLFVAIDRATRWVFVRICPAQTAANARRFLRDLERAAPMKITRVLTDNRKAFTDRLFGLRKREATGQHEFDQLCAELGIEHRLAPPMRPQTNGIPLVDCCAITCRATGRALQRPDRGRPAEPPLPERRGPGTDDPALRTPLQQPAAAIRPQGPDAHRRPQGLATSKARAVQEAGLQSRGM
jgi:transposase InsO family protein